MNATASHRECWELLPWLVNGRLADAERGKLEAHLRECAECREELEDQQRLREHIARDDRVTYSPASSFEKLWGRIEELDREVSAEPVAPRASPAHATRARTRLRAWTHPDTRLSRWLIAAVVVQAIALGWMGSAYISSRPETQWQYRTVTSSPGAGATGTRYRVVFNGNASVADLQRVLARHGLVIVQGSHLSGVFTVAREAELASTDETAMVLKSLREEPAVRFVELAEPGPSP